MHWTQIYDPLGHWWASTLVAALPVVVLLGLLAGFKVKPHWCAIAGAFTAIAVAIVIFKMPIILAVTSFGYGVAFGILKIAWIVLAAVFLYDISVETGQFEIMKESVAAITADRRLQVLLVAFCFGAFIEGAAGFGAPVAIAALATGALASSVALSNLLVVGLYASDCQHCAGCMGSDRHAGPHAGCRMRTSGIRSQRNGRPHSALHRDYRPLLVGARYGGLERDSGGDAGDSRTRPDAGPGRWIRALAV